MVRLDPAPDSDEYRQRIERQPTADRPRFMPHDIVFSDTESNGTVKYKGVFTGDHEPTKTTHRGATKNGNDTKYKNNQGDWVVQGELAGGKDGWTYGGQQKRLAFSDPSRIEIGVNDQPFKPASDFGADTLGSSSGGEDESVVDKISDALDGDDGDKQDASGSWNPGDTSGDRDLDPKHGIVDRDYVTSEDRSPSVGAGGKHGTVQEAMNNVPRNVEHAFEAQLKPGVHSSEPGDSVNVPPINVHSAHGSVRIVGDRDNPEDYVLDARQLNFQFLAGTCQNVGLEGLTVRGTVQNRFGVLELDNVIVKAGQRWNKGDSVALDTYGGHIQCLTTTLKSDGAAMNFVEDASISLSGDCSVDASGPLCTSGQGGGRLVFSGGAEISCPRLSDETWDQSIITISDPHNVTDGFDAGSRTVRLK